MKATKATNVSEITNENQLVLAIADAMSVEGQATKKWRDIVAPGMVKVYKNLEGAMQARDRLIERAITPSLGEPFKLALETSLPDTRSKTGKTIAEQNAKAWKAEQLPTWLVDYVEAMPTKTAEQKTERTKAKRVMKTYKGFVELIQGLKASARAQGKVQFERICGYAWPKPKAEAKPKAKPKAEAEAKNVESEGMPPVQTAIQLSSGLIAYIQKYEAQIPNHVEAIAAIRKAQLLIGDQQ